ncbi:780_t:CDS:1, partial [Cetraspora pellucida]
QNVSGKQCQAVMSAVAMQKPSLTIFGYATFIKISNILIIS